MNTAEMKQQIPVDQRACMKWTIHLWDGFSSSELQREGTYNQVRNSCAGYPPAYIWSIKPRS